MKKGVLFSAVALLAASAFGQTTKYVVIEEKTGTWCGFCPRGTVYMAAEESNSAFIGIAIHNSDPMANSAYDTASDDLPGFGGYPHCAGDRVIGDDPSNIPSVMSTREAVTPAGSVAVGANYDPTDDKIYITVGVTMDSDETGDWRLAAVVVENNITGTSGGYAQSNYYSGGSYGPLNGAGHDWVAEANPVPAASMEYDHVGREMANGAYSGDAGSLPATLTTGSAYYYDYEVDKQSTWDETELHVVGMLIEPDGSINNAFEVAVTISANGIEEETSSFGMFVHPNPTSDVANIKIATDEAADVTVEVYNLMGAVVYTESSQNLAPGKYYYNVDVNNFAAGIYTVKTTVNNVVKTAKLSVN